MPHSLRSNECRYCGLFSEMSPCWECYEDELAGKDLEDQLEELLK